MAYWSTRGLRGSTFEEMINVTNTAYREKGLALIQKLPTPITPVALSEHKISRAYFEKKSTVDYIGVVQGIPVCFDAKETAQKSFPLKNVHEHQISFMREFQAQKGLAFLLVSFAQFNEVFYLPFDELERWFEKAQSGGRKSIPYEAFDKSLLVLGKQMFVVHYLEAIDTYLSVKKD